MKPQNILLDEKMNAKIADFGVSKVLTEANPKGKTMIVVSMDHTAWNPETGKLPDMSFAKEIISTFKFI